MAKTLTPKQESFAQWYVSLGDASKAYRASYDCEGSTDGTVWSRASELLRHSGVAARIEELRAEVAAAHKWRREDSIAVLAEIARSRTEIDPVSGKRIKVGARDSDKVMAVKELNAMHGYNAPTKVDVTARVTGITRRVVDPADTDGT